jgi:hypothetical protein
VHLGTGNYLQRYKTYVTHVQQWRQQFNKLESVDLRYDGQIIVNPDLDGMPRQPALTPVAARAALAAGVKQAAIVNYEKYVAHPPTPESAKPVTAIQKKAPPKRALKKAPHTSQKAKGKPATRIVVKKPPAPVSKIAPRATAPTKPLAEKASAHLPSPAQALRTTGQKKPSPAISKETAQN